MLTYNTLLAANILYTDGVMWNSPVFATQNPKATLSNFYTQLKNALSPKNNSIDYSITKKIARSTKYLPLS
jgi:hypothetical protein